MMTFFRNARVLSSCALLLSSALFAENSNIEPKEQPKTVAVGSRQMDPAKLEQIEAQKLQEAYESDPKAEPTLGAQAAFRRASSKMNQGGYSFASTKMEQPKITLAAFPMSCHWLDWKSPDHRIIKIEDGSSWEIATSDVATLSSWRNDDPLFITPVTSWFVSQHYYISNRVNNTYVRANLVDGSVAFGPYSHWVKGIDLVQGLVFLENQTVWRIDPRDIYILTDRRNNSEWAENDHIITILHDNKSSSYDHILINVNMNNEVHARQY